MRYLLSAVLAFAGGIACVLMVPGIAGIISGAVVAAMLYVGLSLVLRPQARLGGVVASLLPNGEEAARRIEDARNLENQIDEVAADIDNRQVLAEIAELKEGIERLVGYTETHPASFRRLSHFLNTYAEQCVSMLRGYRSLEQSARGETLNRAVEDALSGLGDLQGVVAGELERAMGSEASELSSDSDAIRRLMEMDGYTSDDPGRAGQSETNAKGEG